LLLRCSSIASNGNLASGNVKVGPSINGQWPLFTFNLVVEFFQELRKELPKGENMIKRVKGTKVKVHFQELHMTCVIFVLVYNYFKNCILGIPFNISFFILNYKLILCYAYYAFMLSIHKHEQLFLKAHFQNP
jgi:hypothetical protein